jgi:signal transduction histidine kinase
MGASTLEARPLSQSSPPRGGGWAVLALVGLAVAGLAAAVRLTTSINPPPIPVTALHVIAGAAYVAIGAAASVRRPRNRVGLLLMLVGITWFLVDLQFLPSDVAYTVGNLLGILTYGFLAHLFLAFPSGRLERRVDRVVVIAVYAWMLIGNLLTETLFAAPLWSNASPHILLVLHTSASQNQVANEVQLSVNILLGALVLTVLFLHWKSASRLGRRALAPAIWSSLPLLAIVLALNLVGLVASPAWLVNALPVLTPIALMTAPIAFLAGVIRSNLARLAIGPLVVELRDTSSRQRLRDALARAVGDPTLAIAYRVPSEPQWVGGDGKPVELPLAYGSRSVTLLERDGNTVAALVHDRALDDDPLFIASVTAAASLSIDNERLEAEVRAQLEEVRASRARIVEAGDHERRRLQRDIHDGTQQRLAALALRLGRIRDGLNGQADAEIASGIAEACEQLRLAIGELREISSGIHPALLTESGLGPALQSLADSAALPVRLKGIPNRRLPEPIEAAAYYVVSESLANIAKHASAQSVTVSASSREDRLIISVVDDGSGGADMAMGSGLAGLRDRVAALGGSLTVHSEPGSGTRVIADLPCA